MFYFKTILRVIRKPFYLCSYFINSIYEQASKSRYLMQQKVEKRCYNSNCNEKTERISIITKKQERRI